MTGAPHPRMHGITHVPGGPDPIPGLLSAPSGPGAYDAVILGISDLYGYWRLGEDAGATFADSSGNGHDLTINNGSPNDHPLTHNVGGALVSGDDGAAEFNIPPGETINQNHGEWLEDTVGPNMVPITGCGWIKAKADAGTMADGVAFGTAGVGLANVGWGFCVTWPALTLRFMRYDGAGGVVILDLGASLIPDEWYFVAFTDDAATHRLYVNAVEVDTVAYTETPGAGDSTQAMRVGFGLRQSGGYSYRPFYGTVDEVAVWEKALTLDEIETVYQAGVQSFSTGDVPVSDGDGGVTWGKVPPGSIEPGTDGQVLTTSGSTVVWADPPTGGGASVSDTAAWMPLTTVSAGVPEFVWDGDDQLIPTLTAI